MLLIERGDQAGQVVPPLSIKRQCELLGLARSTVYYEPKEESEKNEALMRLLDEQYTQTPFYGVRRMTAWLRQEGYVVNPKRVGRLLRKMGYERSGGRPYILLLQPAKRLQSTRYTLIC